VKRLPKLRKETGPAGETVKPSAGAGDEGEPLAALVLRLLRAGTAPLLLRYAFLVWALVIPAASRGCEETPRPEVVAALPVGPVELRGFEAVSALFYPLVALVLVSAAAVTLLRRPDALRPWIAASSLLLWLPLVALAVIASRGEPGFGGAMGVALFLLGIMALEIGLSRRLRTARGLTFLHLWQSLCMQLALVIVVSIAPDEPAHPPPGWIDVATRVHRLAPGFHVARAHALFLLSLVALELLVLVATRIRRGPVGGTRPPRRAVAALAVAAVLVLDGAWALALPRLTQDAPRRFHAVFHVLQDRARTIAVPGGAVTVRLGDISQGRVRLEAKDADGATIVPLSIVRDEAGVVLDHRGAVYTLVVDLRDDVGDDDHAVCEILEGAEPGAGRADPSLVIVDQRKRVRLETEGLALWVIVGDITRGEAVLSLEDESGALLPGPAHVRKGARVDFRHRDAGYRLEVVELVDDPWNTREDEDYLIVRLTRILPDRSP
jgi:hypothetical protein